MHVMRISQLFNVGIFIFLMAFKKTSFIALQAHQPF